MEGGGSRRREQQVESRTDSNTLISRPEVIIISSLIQFQNLVLQPTLQSSRVSIYRAMPSLSYVIPTDICGRVESGPLSRCLLTLCKDWAVWVMDVYNGCTSWIEDDCPDTFSEFIFLFPSCSCSVSALIGWQCWNIKCQVKFFIKTAGLVW